MHPERETADHRAGLSRCPTDLRRVAAWWDQTLEVRWVELAEQAG